MELLVDEADWPLLQRYNWSIARGGVVTYIKGKQVSMGTLLLGAKPGYVVINRDRNPLNNRRENLAHATRAQVAARVQRHKGRFRGISRKVVGSNIYWVVIVKQKYRGTFKDEVEAARCYDKAALEEWGEFAVLNFPQC